MMSSRDKLLATHLEVDLRADYVEEGPEWNGRPQWKCKLCPFSTVRELDHALEHIGKAHSEKFPPPEPAKVTVKSKLVDPYNGLTQTVEV